mmetsp:Transcript_72466/g.183442  ORF Transcript_72466/g.183442 Transcript_72466/m.183442 type:complete len:267 (-) Transcript_72466:427-1227(-)
MLQAPERALPQRVVRVATPDGLHEEVLGVARRGVRAEQLRGLQDIEGHRQLTLHPLTLAHLVLQLEHHFRLRGLHRVHGSVLLLRLAEQAVHDTHDLRGSLRILQPLHVGPHRGGGLSDSPLDAALQGFDAALVADAISGDHARPDSMQGSGLGLLCKEVRLPDCRVGVPGASLYLQCRLPNASIDLCIAAEYNLFDPHVVDPGLQSRYLGLSMVAPLDDVLHEIPEPHSRHVWRCCKKSGPIGASGHHRPRGHPRRARRRQGGGA